MVILLHSPLKTTKSRLLKHGPVSRKVPLRVRMALAAPSSSSLAMHHGCSVAVLTHGNQEQVGPLRSEH